MSMNEQAYIKLQEMLKAGTGRSRHEDKKTGEDAERIYSYKTYKTYYQGIKQYISWLQIHHPEIKTMKKARKYSKEWLEGLEGKCSAYTIQTRAKAIGKYYQIKPTDPDYYEPPVRHREDITRSRSTKTTTHFSETKNEILIKFCQGTGMRRSELERITPDCLYNTEMIEAEIRSISAIPEGDRTVKQKCFLECSKKIAVFEGKFEYYIYTFGKGGKYRMIPVLPEFQRDIVEKIRGTASGHRVWPVVNKYCDVHHFRAWYTCEMLKTFSRPIESIPYDAINKGSGKRYQSEVYVCRNNEKGLKLDRRAIYCCEIALGHEKPHTIMHYTYLL